MRDDRQSSLRDVLAERVAEVQREQRRKRGLVIAELEGLARRNHEAGERWKARGNKVASARFHAVGAAYEDAAYHVRSM